MPRLPVEVHPAAQAEVIAAYQWYRERSPQAADLFIRALPSKRRAYQGEQIIIEYQLFFRDGVQLRQSRLADAGVVAFGKPFMAPF